MFGSFFHCTLIHRLVSCRCVCCELYLSIREWLYCCVCMPDLHEQVISGMEWATWHYSIYNREYWYIQWSTNQSQPSQLGDQQQRSRVEKCDQGGRGNLCVFVFTAVSIILGHPIDSQKWVFKYCLTCGIEVMFYNAYIQYIFNNRRPIPGKSKNIANQLEMFQKRVTGLIYN